MFSTGLEIPDSGIYAVAHTAHQLPLEVTLIRGERFPRCCRCTEVVTFSLVRSDPMLDKLKYKIILYELPELENTASSEAAA